MEKEKLLRQIPAVDEIAKWWLEENKESSTLEHPVLIEIIREVTMELRKQIINKKITHGQHLAKKQLVNIVQEKIEQLAEKKLVTLINATGVILHTNLGRAVLCSSGAKAVALVAENYTNLELDLDSGERGSRYSHLEDYLCKLTGAEAVLVVNNNASAVLLTLAALGRGKEAIVSRGELVEIGGSFRIPEVMEQSGVKLVEVGTTNKTYGGDYEQAINENTGLLLKVHTSNYRIVGFTRETTREELVQLGKQHQLPVVEDLGSGCLVDLSQWGINGEPTVQECLGAGIDVVTFSGDKLLGGPQAGIIAGTKVAIDKLKKHPLTRAVRIDKFTVAALEATLKEYISNTAVKNIPTLSMLAASYHVLETRAKKVATRIKELAEEYAEIRIQKGSSMVGGGALPTTELTTAIVAVKPLEVSCQQAAKKLRTGKIKVMVRVQEEQIMLDVRTVFPKQEEQLIDKLKQVLRGEE